MNDEDGQQEDHVKRPSGRRPQRSLTSWLAAAVYLLQTAVVQAAQTAALLLESALIVWQAVAWRGQALRR